MGHFLNGDCFFYEIGNTHIVYVILRRYPVDERGAVINEFSPTSVSTVFILKALNSLEYPLEIFSDR
jgi:hypothetical protein